MKRMETVDEEFTAAAIEWMEKQVTADKPFCLWYNSTAMHFRTHLAAKNARWIAQALYLPQCGLVARTAHAARLAALSRTQHAAIELLRETMTTHSFVAYRDDRPGEAQPITFDGDRWRRYVPIPLPWTVCVRRGVPPGAVAVRINPAHRFTDLILPIDAFDERLRQAIDGRRTLDEVFAAAALDPADAGR